MPMKPNSMPMKHTLAPAGFDALAAMCSPIIFVEARRPGLIERILVNGAGYTTIFGATSESRWISIDEDDLARQGINPLAWFNRPAVEDQSTSVTDYNIGQEGEKRWWRFSFSTLQSENPIRLLITAVPIQDSREAQEQRIDGSADILNDIEDMGNFGHYVFWPEGRRRSWHDGMAQIWSIPEIRSQTEFANMVAMIHPLDLRFKAEPGETPGIKNEVQEVRIVGGDGDVRYVRSHGRRHIDQNGQVIRMVRVDMDVTELRRTEEELRLAREAAADAARAKDAFLHLMNHSLRTPLNAILGFGEAMRDQIYGPLSSDYIHCIDTVNESAHRLLELISDILDLTRLDSGRYSLSKSVCNLDQVISEVVETSGTRLTEKNLRLATQWPDETITVWGEERGLRQILVNLLEFATRPARETHTITLSPALNDDGQAILRLEDDGFGLERTIESAIADPLGTGLSTVQASGASSWFGVSLLKSFLQLHGGALKTYETSGDLRKA